MVVIQQSNLIQQIKEDFYLKEVQLQHKSTECDEFIAGTFIVIMLVFVAEIMEKESDHLIHKFSSQYFIFLNKVTFHMVFSSIKSECH